MSNLVEQAAVAAHEANRSYCLGLGDCSQVSWDQAPEELKQSCRLGVQHVLRGGNAKEIHDSWLKQRISDGWIYGPVKDTVAKTHPCLVAYEDLPSEQQFKDILFRHVVLGVLYTFGNRAEIMAYEQIICRKAANDHGLHGSGAGSLTDQRNRDNAAIAQCKQLGGFVARETVDLDSGGVSCLRCGRPSAQH